MKESTHYFFQRMFKVGYFQPSIIWDKCNLTLTNEVCPHPATCAEYYRGQFGHKVLFLYCDGCYQKWEMSSLYQNLVLLGGERRFTRTLPKNVPDIWLKEL